RADEPQRGAAARRARGDGRGRAGRCDRRRRLPRAARGRGARHAGGGPRRDGARRSSRAPRPRSRTQARRRRPRARRRAPRPGAAAARDPRALRGGRIEVLFCTEGTYPFVEGGVGTWCDIICRELPEVEFTLYAVTGAPEVTWKFEPPP